MGKIKNVFQRIMMKKFFVPLPLFIFSLVILVCCNDLRNRNVYIASDPTDRITQTPYNEEINTYPVNTLYIETPNVSPLFTTTPKPSLVPSMRMERAINLLKSGTDNCTFPCFLNITPGKTTWIEAEQIMKNKGITFMSIYDQNWGAYNCINEFDFNDISLGGHICLYEGNGIVSDINIFGQRGRKNEDFSKLWSIYSPVQIMKKYGPPSQVWMTSYAVDIGDSDFYGYNLLFKYELLGLYLRYDGNVKREEIYHICPEISNVGDIDKFVISVFSPHNMPPLQDFVEFKGMLVLPIQEATGLTKEKFFEIMTSEDNPNCFESPRSLWVPK